MSHPTPQLFEATRGPGSPDGGKPASPGQSGLTVGLGWIAGAVSVLVINRTGSLETLVQFRVANQVASVDRMAFPLPDKPSTCRSCSYENLSGDPKA